MKERKKLAQQIYNKFFLRTLVVLGVILILCIIASATRLFGTGFIGILLGIVLLIVSAFMLYMMGVYDNARTLMIARALVGREISDNPVKEGLDLLNKFGNRRFIARKRSFGIIMRKATKGIIKITSYLAELNIPLMPVIAKLINNVVKTAYNNTAKMILCYQLGYFEDSNMDQFYDLVTYYVQDGKNFLLRTIKREIRSSIIAKVAATVTVLGIIAFYATHSPLAVILAVLPFVILLIGTFMGMPNPTIDTMADYIEYVQTHALNTQLKSQIVAGLEITDNVIDIKRAVQNPNTYNLRRAANSVEDISRRINK
ncbi:MAG: hypothetical protein K6G87_11395 [Butyrivibrio sp.]|uniref:hypothetical protein n=1 Tax=Butyrivibrio sp. TaxID=28121 RepID=UPI0025EC4292|nr:hypothetical protein [Butyrivibrio sp.]MCR5771816.1 hypothetical protein [Butyrivibrio sp.]